MLNQLVVYSVMLALNTVTAAHTCEAQQKRFEKALEHLLSTSDGADVQAKSIAPRAAGVHGFVAQCLGGDAVVSQECMAALPPQQTLGERLVKAEHWYRWQGHRALRQVNLAFRQLRLQGCLQMQRDMAQQETLLLWGDPHGMTVLAPYVVEQVATRMERALASPAGEALRASASYRDYVELAGEFWRISTDFSEEDEEIREALLEDAVDEEVLGERAAAVGRSAEWQGFLGAYDALPAVADGLGDLEIIALTFVRGRWVTGLKKETAVALLLHSDLDDGMGAALPSAPVPAPMPPFGDGDGDGNGNGNGIGGDWAEAVLEPRMIDDDGTLVRVKDGIEGLPSESPLL